MRKKNMLKTYQSRFLKAKKQFFFLTLITMIFFPDFMDKKQHYTQFLLNTSGCSSWLCRHRLWIDLTADEGCFKGQLAVCVFVLMCWRETV